MEPVPLAYNLIEPDGCTTDKAPVIILHGCTASKEDWRDIPNTVANVTLRKVYALDSRNHGENPWSEMCSFDCNVDDLLNFMDTMQIPKAILIGHSMGGITSIKTALKAPERVEKAVIEDMIVSKINPEIIEAIYNEVDMWRKAIDAMPTGLDEQNARNFMVDFIESAVPPEKKKITRFVERCNSIALEKTKDGRFTFKSNIDGLLYAVKREKDTEYCACGKYEGPICFIYGELSPIKVPDDEEEIKKFFPNAELVGIDGAKHNVHTDCPDEFKEALLDFLLKE